MKVKVSGKMPISIMLPLKRANSTERERRKVSDLEPEGQGSGIAEVVSILFSAVPFCHPGGPPVDPLLTLAPFGFSSQ
jgi:hypothetical protein